MENKLFILKAKLSECLLMKIYCSYCLKYKYSWMILAENWPNAENFHMIL